MARTVIGKLSRLLKNTKLTLEITAGDYEGTEVPLTTWDEWTRIYENEKSTST